MGHVTCHVTFSGKKPLFEKLVAVPEKRVLDARQLFSFGMTVPLFTENFYGAKGRFFQQNSTFDHLYLLKTKSRKIILDVVR